MKAQDILRKSAQHIEGRAAARDQAEGERSMARTVAAFNALTGHQLSERDGWLFMVQLKMARACTTPTGIPDDYEDGASYVALAGESVAQPVPMPVPVNDNAPKPGELVEIIIIQGVGEVQLRAGYSWIAKDADGSWWAYETKPVSTGVGWLPEDTDTLIPSILGHGTPNQDWKETLRRVRG